MLLDKANAWLCIQLALVHGARCADSCALCECSAAATADGLIASASEDNTARLWRADGTCLQVHYLHQAPSLARPRTVALQQRSSAIRVLASSITDYPGTGIMEIQHHGMTYFGYTRTNTGAGSPGVRVGRHIPAQWRPGDGVRRLCRPHLDGVTRARRIRRHHPGVHKTHTDACCHPMLKSPHQSG